MSKRILILTALGVAVVAAGADSGWARGFGGGGFRGGDFGGFRGGDFDGYRGDDFDASRAGGWGRDQVVDDPGRFNFQSYDANRFGGDREARFNAAAAAPDRAQINRFLGLPSDEGFHQLSAARSANVAGVGAAARRTPTQRQATANYVRNNWNHWNGYSAGWYEQHPGAWVAAGWGAGAAWNFATWGALGGWFDGFTGYGSTDPIDYDYGNDIVYQDGDVYIDGRDVDSAARYYSQVAAQAAGGADANTDPNGQWLPLGVFALTHGDQQPSTSVVQLAVDKQGVIRGNYTDTVADTSTPIQGSVDKTTQRVAWTIGNNQATVLEAGLYNLTQSEAPVLIHFGADKTQQWLLVRLDNNQAADAAPQPAAGSN